MSNVYNLKWKDASFAERAELCWECGCGSQKFILLKGGEVLCDGCNCIMLKNRHYRKEKTEGFDTPEQRLDILTNQRDQLAEQFAYTCSKLESIIGAPCDDYSPLVYADVAVETVRRLRATVADQAAALKRVRGWFTNQPGTALEDLPHDFIDAALAASVSTQEKPK